MCNLAIRLAVAFISPLLWRLPFWHRSALRQPIGQRLPATAQTIPAQQQSGGRTVDFIVEASAFN
jgi:hypothetical protein